MSIDDLEASLSKPTRVVLAALRTARTKQEGARHLEDLIALAGTRPFARDLEALLTSREDVDVYARRLRWKTFKVHLVEECVVPAGHRTAERVATALAGPRLRQVRKWLIDAVVRHGDVDWVPKFGAARVRERTWRPHVLNAIEAASFGSMTPRYARWALEVVELFAERPSFATLRTRLNKALR